MRDIESQCTGATLVRSENQILTTNIHFLYFNNNPVLRHYGNQHGYVHVIDVLVVLLAFCKIKRTIAHI